MPKDVVQILQERGFMEWCSDPEELSTVFKARLVSGYIGFDPTADSLHVGHLVPIMGLAWLQRAGHQPIAVAGGGTGLIGDPSGKTKERQLLTLEQVESNMASIKKQIEHFLDFNCGESSAKIVNNYTWLSKLGLLEFLRDIGKYFTVNFMIARDYVKTRLEDPDKFITYTEFSYILLQAYDFYHLYKHENCILQMGGNDQQVNIIAGIDLIRKKLGGKAYGLTYPLLLTASGQKFGKTEEGTVWLSPSRTTPYKFYQYWIWVAFVTSGGGFMPSFCHAKHPSTAQASMPGSSASSFSVKFLSCSSGGMVTLKGISLMRSQIALSVPRIIGLWFVAIHILCVWSNWK